MLLNIKIVILDLCLADTGTEVYARPSEHFHLMPGLHSKKRAKTAHNRYSGQKEHLQRPRIHYSALAEEKVPCPIDTPKIDAAVLVLIGKSLKNLDKIPARREIEGHRARDRDDTLDDPEGSTPGNVGRCRFHRNGILTGPPRAEAPIPNDHVLFSAPSPTVASPDAMGKPDAF